MRANQADHAIAVMAGVLGVSRQGCYAWLAREPGKRAVEDRALTKRIVRIHADSYATYGAPRIHAELRAEGTYVGRKRVARLMRNAVIAGVSWRRYVTTAKGFLYLAVVLDAWSREIVGWAMRGHLRTELVLEALDMALQRPQPVHVIHHSAQGCQ